MTPFNFMPHQRTLLAAALALLLAACATAPVYEKPAVEVSAAFKESGLWKVARAGTQAAVLEVPDAWWQLFKDPVLNELQAGVAIGNENLKASAAQVQVARAALASARAGGSPALGVSSGITYGANGAGSTPNTLNSIAANASWELDLWGRVATAVSGAEARVQASSADLAAARLSLQALLTQTYFALRSSEAQADLLERSVLAFQRSLELTTNRYNAGVVSAADVAQATTQLRATQSQLIDAKANRAQLEHAIATLLGKPPAAFDLKRSAELPQAPFVPVQLPAQLLERRPDIAASERRVAAANAQIGVAQSAFFPAITLSGSAGFRGAQLLELISAPNLFWSLGPALALSLFDGGARQAGVDSAKASIEQATASYRQTVLSAFQEVEDNLVAAASLEEQIVLQSDALKAAGRSLDIANNQYSAGIVSYLNVVTAQATALSSERALLDLRNRRLVATAQLLKNLGGRWELARP